MPKISVIVPIYNSQKWLNRCIDSILNQTYKNFELILINDGSSDKSGQICEEYKKQDNRVIVIHKENGGVSSARNKGLEIAQGEYITFIDSDDYIEHNMFEIMIELMGINIDLLISSLNFYQLKQEKMILNKCFKFENKDFNLKDFIVYYYNSNIVNFGLWAKFYRNEIIKENKLKFLEEMTYEEDVYFNFQYLEHCKQIRLSSEPLYNISCENPSSLSRKFRITNYKDYKKFYFIQEEIIKKLDLFDELNNKIKIGHTSWLFLLLFRAVKTRDKSTCIEYMKLLNNDKELKVYPKENKKLHILYYFIKFKLYTLLYIILKNKEYKI